MIELITTEECWLCETQTTEPISINLIGSSPETPIEIKQFTFCQECAKEVG